MRIVVDIRKDANAQVILNQLYQYPQLQDTVGVIMLAIDHKVPKVMTLKQMIQKYVEFPQVFAANIRLRCWPRRWLKLLSDAR